MSLAMQRIYSYKQVVTRFASAHVVAPQSLRYSFRGVLNRSIIKHFKELRCEAQNFCHSFAADVALRSNPRPGLGKRHTRILILASIATFVACAAAPPSAELGAQQSTVARDARAHHDPKQRAKSSLPLLAVPARAAARPAQAPQDARPSPLLLQLPTEPQFLDSPLPVPRPERYRQWRARGRIWVGQSHLQQLELVNGERTILALSHAENAVRAYSRTSKRLLARQPVSGAEAFESLALARWPEPEPDSSARYLIGKGDGLWLASVENGELTQRLAPQPASDLRWSPDQRVLVAAASEIPEQRSTLRFFHREGSQSLTLLGQIDFAERVDAWDLSRDNRCLVVLYYPSNTMALLDLHTGTPLWRIPVPQFGGDVSFSPDGTVVAMGGSSLLLVDVTQPNRRVAYDAFANNIGQVRFSPSGDAVATSSYDGKIRIFDPDVTAPEVALLKTLSHAGSANVYSLRFAYDGEELISSSGDQTIRFWGGGASPPPTGKRQSRTWHPLRLPLPPTDQYEGVDLNSLSEAKRRALLEELLSTPRHHPALLDEPPRPSRIASGTYACRVSKGYRMRDCVVEKLESGHVILEVKEGNLLGMRGLLYDDGAVVRFEGWTTEERPFKCFTCQDRCFIQPQTCTCRSGAIERTRSCLRQPVHAAFKGAGRHWKGVIVYHDYFDEHLPPLPPPANFAFQDNNNQFTIELVVDD